MLLHCSPVVVVAAFRVGERSRTAAESYAAAREYALAEAASAAVRADRLAVARELHDAISGTIGVIVLQAGAAEMLWLQDPARARRAAAPAVRAGPAGAGLLPS